MLAGVAVLLALGIAGAVTGVWETLLLWIHRVPFSSTQTVADPIFGRDVSFFLFELPFYRAVQSLVNGLLLASLGIAGARYLLAATRGGEVFITRVRVHLAVLGGLYLLSIAFGYQLDKYELVYSTAGASAVTGVAFADANARFLAYDVLTFLSGLAGALLVAGAFTRWMWPLAVIVIVWFSASIVLGRLYPEAIQRLSVDPNTYAQEAPYIANNISMTRLAFGIDQWEQRSYGGEQPLTEAGIRSEADTFTNARLWDYRPLQTTLDQLQTVRQYYDFYDVDTDRYQVDGDLRQVMLSGRELAIDRNTDADSWVNQRIIYTHGIGLAMVPVNEVTPEGQPRLWVRDLPPVSNSGAPEITQPRIYFGERDNHYVIVRARQAEFDYPSKSGNEGGDPTTSWTGTNGIPLDSTLNKLLFAIRFRDLDLLITDQIQADSQLLFHRTLGERLGMIAPFLRFDKDPYLVVDGDGKLVFVQDAYTVSDRFPQATWFDTGELGGTSGFGGEAINYLRNSVKITVDAYDGTMHFYVADPDEPLIRAWQGIFPSLFEPMANMPASLQSHLRFPEELFNVQTRVYGQYHVTQPLTFFNQTDRWTIPSIDQNDQSLPPEAYYVVMRMPGEPKAEFLLLQPMIARQRPNMIAWVAARNDAPNYGTVRAYQFPADTTIFGPAQIEARIDQDPTISAQITLWNQSGSRVIRGNLLVVPVGDSLIYLQPVYLQSTSSAFPEFQRIVVASPSTVVWGRTLSEALTLLLTAQGGGPGRVARPLAHAGSVRDRRPVRHAAADPPAGKRAADRRHRAGRVREHALRAGPGRAPERRLRDLRHRDGARRGGSPGPGRADRVAGAEPRALTPAAAVSSAPAPAHAGRLAMTAVLPGAIVVTLVRPLSWLLGLAGFLAGGGLLLMAAPVVVLPTPTGIQNALGAPLSTLLVGTPSTAMVLVIAGAAGAGLVLLLGGLLAGAWAERHLIALQLAAADDEGLLATRPLDGAPGTVSVAIVRALALLPVIAVGIVAWQPVYDAAYRELVLPIDLVTPLGLRVIRDVPELVIAVLVAWIVGDSAAALGVRRLVIGRRPILVAWLLGWIDLVRRPLRVVVTALFGTAALALLAAPGLLAAASGWARVRDVMTASRRRHRHPGHGRDLGRRLARRARPGGRRGGDPGGRLDARVDAARRRAATRPFRCPRHRPERGSASVTNRGSIASTACSGPAGRPC